MFLEALCDIQQDEQILCNYAPGTVTRMSEDGPLIPFANVTLGQLVGMACSVMFRRP